MDANEKPVIKFTAVPYEIGGHKGYRPQLEAQSGKFDLAFTREVVTEKRLSMSAEELLHGVEMLAEVAGKKIAEDGRPRGITKLLKWNRFASGKLESPSSPWNDTCKATIRPQLMAEATRVIDATFENVTNGIGVRLNDVTFDGAKTVQNVIKQDGTFSANGAHMEFLEGDTASIVYGETVIPLECLESDVSHARFAAPESLFEIEAGSQVQFIMKSRGGVKDGQVYTSKKTVTLLAGTRELGPHITSLKSRTTGGEGEWRIFRDTLDIKGYGFDEDTTATLRLLDGEEELAAMTSNKSGKNVLTRESDGKLVFAIDVNETEMTDGAWEDASYDVELVLKNSKGEARLMLIKRVNA